MVIPGYEINQEIGRNDWQTLYRGRRNADQQPVLLKVPHRQPGGAIEVKLLEHEFEILRDLALAGIPRAYDLIRDDGVNYLVLEDCGGAPLRALLSGRPQSLDLFFNIALKLASLLSELHRREIIHQSINPDNILINDVTGDVCLTGFGLASRSASETNMPFPSHLLRGALVYLSPEQTGRMNRVIDYRTDFYSLGGAFYEMLTGSPPYRSPSGCDDALEMIHWHIAKSPPAPSEVTPEIPEPLSNIVMKLLAKTAEERYQCALGLKEDLAHCAREWEARRTVEPFALGGRDVPDRFLISQRLYGRRAEVAELLGAFDRVCQGRAAPVSMTLVAGYSGVGKTSLIQELYKPIVRERGYFISGKFDQVVRGVPFGALIQAFRGLAQQLLTESEERLTRWRARLSEALGAQGGVLTGVIPEIELIIGKQPPHPALGPTEALNRFQLVFQNFVGELTAREHPLVVFLDDLQWADAATLGLLQPLLTNHEIECLFMMGAYRDNEVDAGHPLMRCLTALESAGAELKRIMLGPLELPDLTLLVRDTLQGELADAEPLARLVLEKTGGNPFFVIQFLKTLHQEGFIEFDYEQCRWTYRLDAIANAPLTDNVIDLMTRKIQRLSDKTQRALTLASCIGDPFDPSTLAVVSEQSLDAAADDLKEAINEGLILPSGEWGIGVGEREGRECGMGSGEWGEVSRSRTTGPRPPAPGTPSPTPHSPLPIPHSYSFLHDRVRQAAYALIPEQGKQPVHLTVGRLLRLRMETDQSEEKLFDIVHHLNLGSSLMDEESERLGLARLNLSAGRKAKSSTAHAAALDYFKAGSSLLDETHWESNYDLTFALHFEAAECEYLCGNFDAATASFVRLLERAKTELDKARVYGLRMVQYENMSRYADALASAREGLALFGVSFPDSAKEKEAALEREIEAIQTLLGGRSIESLIDLPVMNDPAVRMVMSILTDIWASTYILGDAALARLISATMVRLSLLHGNLAESAYGYVTHAITVGPVRGDYAAAYEFGLLALSVNEKFNDARRRAKIYQQFHAHVALWRQPMGACIPYAQEACRSGLESGDFLYAAYGAATETWPALVATHDLAQFLRDYMPVLALLRKLKNTGFADAHQLILNWVRALRGETDARLSLSAEGFDEKVYAETYDGNPFFTMFYLTARLHLAYLFEENEQALEATQGARRLASHLSGTIWPALVDFWGGLTLAACYGNAAADERRAYLQEIKESQAALSILAENCPENYLCPSLLLAAEIERVAGQEMAALDLYEQAIRYAGQTSMIQYQALANELYARFWRDRGQTAAAAVFIAKARDNYAQWGAAAKVAEIESRYAELLRRQAGDGIGAAQTAAADRAGALDLFSVMKAAQAIAGEIDLKKLPLKLLRIVIENAGAERGSLILEHGGEFFVHAAAGPDSAEAQVVPLNEARRLPKSIVNYVRRTSESIVLADAQSDDRYGSDPYIARHRPRSVMCLPVRTQARLAGVLYLENNLVSGAFTPDRMEMMQTLSAQAAISLENALLYDETRQAEETLRSIVEGTAAVTGSDFFRSMAQRVASVLQVRYAFVTECRDQTKTKARSLAFWKGDGFGDNFEYDVAATPCQKVLNGEVCYYSENVQQLFPEDQGLVELDAQSYLGIPIPDSSGRVIGHLAVLDDKPMSNTPRSLSLLQIFAARAGAELDRLQAEEEVRSLNLKLAAAARRAHTLLEINNAVISNLTQEALFNSISQALRRVVPFDRNTIFLYDPKKDALRLFITKSRMVSNRIAPGLELPVGESNAGWAFQNQRYLLRRDLEKERQYPIEDMLLAEGIQSLIIAPMIVRGKSIGTLNVGSETRNQYSESDAEFLQEVANQVALAVENMMAFEEITELKARLERENVYLQEEIRREHNFEEIVGSSPALLAVLQEVERVAPADTTALIFGETGTGKELIARAIHNLSARHDRPLVKVNCGAISAGLVESELFGHVKGAFTGAFERRTGRFELADGGTLFLDEVGELPLDTQVKLLRVLQDGEFEPVGSSKTVRVDVRIIAATNRNLEEAVRAGRFRADLFYRLNVLPLRAPALRERRSDIPQLVMFFMARFARKFGKNVEGVSQETMNLLINYPWPGNIRELQNIIERGVALAEGPILTLNRNLFPASSFGEGLAAQASAAAHPGISPSAAAVTVAPASVAPLSLEEIERRHILAVLEQTRWVIEGPQGAAKVLNLHPNTLRGRLKKLGIRRPGAHST